MALGLGIWYYRSQKSTVEKDDVKPKSPTPTPIPTVNIEEDKIATAASANSLSSEPASDGPDSAPVETAPVVQDPYKQSQVFKNKGNKYFKEGKFADAIKCYQQAIDLCPKTKVHDISTFHQNRAAAYEQLVILQLSLKAPNLQLPYLFDRKIMMLLSRIVQRLFITILNTRKPFIEGPKPTKSPSSLKIVWKISLQFVS